MQFTKKTGAARIAAGLAALCLTGARPAAAQILNLSYGDNVSVSGAGTTRYFPPYPPTTDPNATSYSNNSGGLTVNVKTGANFSLDTGGSVSFGGNTLGAILANGGSVEIHGGNVTLSPSAQNAYLLGCGPGGTLDVTGGTFDANHYETGLFVYGGTARMSGGTLLDPSGSGFSVSSGGVIDLFGTFTDAQGNPLLGPYTSGYGSIKGTFLNGDVLPLTYYSTNTNPGGTGGGTLEINVGAAPAVPEASSLALFGLGLAGMAAFGGRRRRSASANA